MELRCPGRASSAAANTTLIDCPNCGHTVEIFGDEVRFHCRCGQWVFRDVAPSCAQWCSEAERCFGAIGSLKKLLNDAGNITDREEQERRLKELRKRIALAQESCCKPELKQQPLDSELQAESHD